MIRLVFKMFSASDWLANQFHSFGASFILNTFPSRDSKLIIPTLFLRQAPKHHLHTRPVTLQETRIQHRLHIRLGDKGREMVHGEISPHLGLAGLPTRGGIEILLDQEIESTLIYILNVIEGMDFLVLDQGLV